LKGKQASKVLNEKNRRIAIGDSSVFNLFFINIKRSDASFYVYKKMFIHEHYINGKPKIGSKQSAQKAT